jgi:hypothetical protein
MELIRTIDSLGPTRLDADEQQELREHADALVFAREWDHEVLASLRAVRALGDRLVDAGRASDELSHEILLKVRACGPVPLARAASPRLLA